MRIAVIILGALLVAAGIALLAIGAGGDGAGGAIKMGIGGVLALAGGGVGLIAIFHPRIAAAAEQRGEPAMPVGRMVASLGALCAVWLYNLAILAVLIVLTIRLI